MRIANPSDTVSRSALVLVVGRVIGFAASFSIGIVLARVLDQADFGAYKEFFLVFSTLYGLAQLGVAESLYYFIPRRPAETARYVGNALVTLAFAGAGSAAVLVVWRHGISAHLNNLQLADEMVLLGLFLTFMLMSAVLEIVLVSRKRHITAAVTYAASDIGRTACLILPALVLGGLHAVFVGAVVYAAVRLAFLFGILWREFGGQLRIDAVLWRHQLAYALPFALAVGVEVVQINFHQYVVASRFDAATFAIYAVGCLQIPLVDLIASSTVNVLMVKLAEDSRDGRAALALFHETVFHLAFLIVPLVVLLLVVAPQLIVALFTTRYSASVPIFMVWNLTMLLSVFAVDAVLRAYAQTRFLLLTNLLRLALVAMLIVPFLSAFGLSGAVLITLLTTTLVKALGLVRIARVLEVPVSAVLPWARLRCVVIRAGVSAAPALYVTHAIAAPVVALAAGSVTYVLGYLMLSYGSWVVERMFAPLPIPLGRRFSFRFTQDD